VNPDLLSRLLCPATRTPLRWDEARKELVSDEAGLAYPVRDGVPVLLIEEARPVFASPSQDGEGDHPQGGGGVSAPAL
jgi:uncharacterized protein YbaR (Trm112 family)